MVSWNIVEFTHNFKVFVTVNNKGRFYFSTYMAKLCQSASYTCVKPLISTDKKFIGFKFSMQYESGFYFLKNTNDCYILYCDGLAKICLNGAKSITFPLLYDEEENVWYFKLGE